MSKALVIKGANFAANKVEIITLSQVIPCTGISISPTTVAFDALGATQQITATVTPVDTTNTVYYVSSNTDVVTVSAAGLITCVGVGSATVTATCGTQSATCTVTSTVTYNLDDKYRFNGYNIGTTNLSAVPPRDYVGVQQQDSTCIILDTVNHLNGYKAVNGNNSSIGLDNKYPLILPPNCTKISISADSAFKYAGIALEDATQKNTYNTSATAGALVVAYTGYNGINLINGVGNYMIENNVGNSFVLALSTGNNSNPASEVTNLGLVTFS